MGLWLSKLYDVFSEFSGSTPARILMLGLDAAGNLILFLYDLLLLFDFQISLFFLYRTTKVMLNYHISDTSNFDLK